MLLFALALVLNSYLCLPLAQYRKEQWKVSDQVFQPTQAFLDLYIPLSLFQVSKF